MPVTERPGGDAARSWQSSPRYTSDCVLDITESEECTPSSSSNNYWSELGEFILYARHNVCLTVASPVVVNSSVLLHLYKKKLNSSSPKVGGSRYISKLPVLGSAVASVKFLRTRLPILTEIRGKFFLTVVRFYAGLRAGRQES